MKKIVLLTSVSLLLLTLSSSAQIKKGSVLLGGGISGGKSKYESSSQENTSSGISFYPSVGIALKDNVVVGLDLSYSHSKSDQPNPTYVNRNVQNNYSAGVFYRRYTGLGKNFYLFGNGSLYYGRNEQTQESGLNTSVSKSVQKRNGVGLGFYPGVAYAVSKRFHLEIGLNNLVSLYYSKNKTENTTNNTTTTTKGSDFSFTTNVSSNSPIALGFRVVLGK